MNMICMQCVVAIQANTPTYELEQMRNDDPTMVDSRTVFDVNALVVFKGQSLCLGHFNTTRGHKSEMGKNLVNEAVYRHELKKLSEQGV